MGGRGWSWSGVLGPCLLPAYYSLCLYSKNRCICFCLVSILFFQIQFSEDRKNIPVKCPLCSLIQIVNWAPVWPSDRLGSLVRLLGLLLSGVLKVPWESQAQLAQFRDAKAGNSSSCLPCDKLKLKVKLYSGSRCDVLRVLEILAFWRHSVSHGHSDQILSTCWKPEIRELYA